MLAVGGTFTAKGRIIINSFIPWIGGKSQLRGPILSAFPEETPERYVEVFGGAGWILFSKDKHAPLEVFNDIDGNLINLYRCVQYHCGELQRELRMCENQLPPNSRELFFDYKEQLNMRGITDIQRAARYFYLIRISYGADRRTFGCSKKALAGAIDRLPEIQRRLKDTVIENRDFESVIKTYDRPKALFYLDPPYYKAERFYEGFSSADHERLRGCLDGIKGKFVLSYNDTPEIREYYSDFKIHALERLNNLSGKTGSKGSYKELIITNF